jgi:hypothetical protein
MSVTDNTHASDVNEILLAYFLNAQTWADDWKAHLVTKKTLLSPEQQAAQYSRAKAMADACRGVLSSDIERVWWVARPGGLAKAMEMPSLDSKRNPSDVLVKLVDGTYVGFSAKSTDKKKKIALKNPGLSSIGAALDIDFQSYVDKSVQLVCEKFNLPSSATARKNAIRTHPRADAIRLVGDACLSSIREAWFNRLAELTPDALRAHVTRFWLDLDPVPPYWRVVGSGGAVAVENPYDSPALKAFMTDYPGLDLHGETIIGITAGGLGVLKMRIKFESEKLASPVKFSGEAC